MSGQFGVGDLEKAMEDTAENKIKLKREEEDDLKNNICKLYHLNVNNIKDPSLSIIYHRVYNKNYEKYLTKTNNKVNAELYANKKAVKYLSKLKSLAMNKSDTNCVSNHPWMIKLIRFITWIFKIGGMGLSVGLLTYYIFIPLIYSVMNIGGNKICTSFKLSKYITITLTLIFMIIYISLNIPQIFTSDVEYIGENISGSAATVLNTAVLPIVNLAGKVFTKIEYSFFDIITFGYISRYWQAVQFAVSAAYTGLADIENFDCSSKEDMNALAATLQKLENNPVSRIELQNYDLTSLVSELAVSMSDDKMNELLENKQYFSYMFAKLVRRMVCSGLKFGHWLYKILKGIGSEDTIIDMIDSGNIAGVSYSIAFIIIYILVSFGVTIFGIKYYK